MKELSIEQKAKRYDEAIRKLRGMIPNWERLSYNGKTFLQDLIYILPELKESEDEKIRKAIVKMISDIDGGSPFEKYGIIKKEALAWLEKQGKKDEEILILKDQIESLHAAIEALKEAHKIELEKQKQEWSEEDEENLNWFEKFFRAESVIAEGKDIPQDRYLWLKNLKGRVQPKPKQEWSEEDIGNLLDVKCIIDEVWHSQYAREDIDHSGEELESLWHWLDELWQRIEYPQSTWKPSDMELEVLRLAAEKDGICLMKLYEQLKKLREE